MRSPVAWCLLVLGCAPQLASEPPPASARAPLVSAEVDVADLLTRQPSAGWAGRTNGHLRAAGGATQGLVAWVEDRSGQYDVWGARIDAAGAVMDPAGLLLSTGPVLHGNVTVASSGAEHLVAWDESFNSGPQRVRATIVQGDGALRTPLGFNVFTGNNYVEPAASFDGTRFVVVARTSPPAIHASRITPQGAVLDTTPISLIGPQASASPAVASLGATSLVVWPDSRLGNNRIFGARLSAAGVVLDPGGVQLGSSAGSHDNVAVAAGDTGWLVSWIDSAQSPPRVAYTRVNAAGQRLDVTDRLLPADVRALFSTPTLTWSGSFYTVGWVRQSLVQGWAARVTSDGGVLDPAGFQAVDAPHGFESPALLSVGNTTLLAFSDRAYQKAQVRATRLAGGAALDAPPRLLSAPGNGQQQLALARSDGGALLVWAEQRDTTFFDVRGTRLDPAGQPLDVPALTLAVSGDDESEPAVAFDGTSWLLAWTRRPAVGGSALVEGVRVSTAGVVLGPTVSYGTGNQPAVAASPAGALVAWSKYNDAVSWNDIAFTRVSPTGVLLDVPARYAVVATLNQTVPKVAFDGARYLVAWEDGRNAGQAEIYAARVELNGALPDGTGFMVSNGAGFGRLPGVAASPTQFLVAWSQQPASPAAIMANRIVGGRVADGTGFAVANMTVAYPEVGPAVAWAGTQFNVVWTDVRDGGLPALYAVGLNGTTAQPEEAIGPGTAPVLSQVPGDWGVLAYERLDLAPTVMNRRARVRLAGLRGEGAACTALECLPGLSCFAGRCCRGGCGDAGVADAGVADAGATDAGVADAGGSDAGPGDVDAGADDAGAPAAGRDGGQGDAGPGGRRDFSVGCQSSPALAAWAVLGLLAAVRRRAVRP